MATLTRTFDNRGFVVNLRSNFFGGFQKGSQLVVKESCNQVVGRLAVSARGAGAFRPSSRPKPTRTVKGRPQMEGDRDDTPAMNEDIRAREVRLMAADKSLLGVCSRDEALEKAQAANMDLVMIAPDASPPVVRIMDYSKYRFEQQKKKRELQKKAAASRSELKELKMRYNIETHDYDVRLRSARKFLASGDRVKVSVQFRGREMEFKDIAFKLFTKFQADVGEIGSIDSKPKMDGKILQMVLAPNKITAQKEKAAERKARVLQNKSTLSSSTDEVGEVEEEGEVDEEGEVEEGEEGDNIGEGDIDPDDEGNDAVVGNVARERSEVEQFVDVDQR